MQETPAIYTIYITGWDGISEARKSEQETKLNKLFDDLNLQIDKICTGQLPSKKQLWQIYKSQLYSSMRTERNLGYFPDVPDNILELCCLTYVCGAMAVLAGTLAAINKLCTKYGRTVKLDGLIGQCTALFAVGPKRFTLWLGGILDMIDDADNIWKIFCQTGSIQPFLQCTWPGQPLGGSLLTGDDQDLDDTHSIKDIYKILASIFINW